ISVRLRAVLTHGAVGRYRTTSDPSRDSDFHPIPSADAGWTDPFALPSSGGTLSTFDLAFVEQISIGDFVWNDIDNDGVQDSGEPGLEGVTVEIWDDARTVLLDSTTTDALGKYVVRVRGSGDYALRIVKPPGLWRFSPREAGASRTVDSNVDSTGWTDVEVLPTVIAMATLDAGLSRITLTPGLLSGEPLGVGRQTRRAGRRSGGWRRRISGRCQLCGRSAPKAERTPTSELVGGGGSAGDSRFPGADRARGASR
ncbi:MAG: hypothetical protein JHD16_17595, partial [Solirubrobacteraceae bacterium]|nr:hypothetical protein [Solirubrobacteraceae bacterium]